MNLDHIDKQVTRRQTEDNGAVATLTQTLGQRLAKFSVDSEVIDRVRSVNMFRKKRVSVGGHEVVERKNRTWVVLPSHPLWHSSGLAAEIRTFLEDPQAVGLWALAQQSTQAQVPLPDFAVSWKNSLRHLFVRLRRQ